MYKPMECWYDLELYGFLVIIRGTTVINRPGLAGAVLHTAS